jgi:hypothetical protein
MDFGQSKWVMEDLSYIYQYCCAGILFLISFSCAVWAFRDAQRRGVGGCLIALLVFFTFPIGLMLWVLLRPSDYRHW